MIFPNIHCDCKEQYKSKFDANYEWCKSCLINNLEQNFTKWTSGNEKINSLIQKMQLEINYQWETIFEWIPYNQLYNIEKKISTIYSAIWKDGPLRYSRIKNKYTREQHNAKVILKLYNLQNTNDEFLNEVCNIFFNLIPFYYNN
jgi:hypothetical protein